jgi:hypothetical protein
MNFSIYSSVPLGNKLLCTLFLSLPTETSSHCRLNYYLPLKGPMMWNNTVQIWADAWSLIHAFGHENLHSFSEAKVTINLSSDFDMHSRQVCDHNGDDFLFTNLPMCSLCSNFGILSMHLAMKIIDSFSEANMAILFLQILICTFVSQQIIFF